MTLAFGPACMVEDTYCVNSLGQKNETSSAWYSYQLPTSWLHQLLEATWRVRGAWYLGLYWEEVGTFCDLEGSLYLLRFASGAVSAKPRLYHLGPAPHPE